MTNTLRQQIREAIDARVRATRQAFIDAGELQVCAGCGCDQDVRTAGCRNCDDRHRKWRLRTDPAYLERVREYERNRKRPKREVERLRRLRAKQAAL